jgi:hypothetical protein
MNESALDLSNLFGAALQTMTAQRQEINALDGYNGNHGDNMVENLRMITEALDAKRSQPPSEALRFASQQLQSKGHGGTSQYYARGLNDAAEQLQGRSSIGQPEVMSLVQSLLGAIPSQGHPQQMQGTSSVLSQVLGMAAGQQPQPGGDMLGQVLGMAGGQQPQAGGDLLGQVLGMAGGQEPQAGDDLLGQVLGMAGGQEPQAGGDLLGQVLGMAGGQQPQAGGQDDGLDMGDVVSTLLPAGLAFLQAKQSGADTASALGQALTSALMGGQVNPLQAGTPRAAAGGLIAQSILKALTSR